MRGSPAPDSAYPPDAPRPSLSVGWRDRALRVVSPALLLATAGLMAFDLVDDLRRGVQGSHGTLEIVGVTASWIALALLWRVASRSAARARELARAVDRSRSERVRSRAHAAGVLQALGDLLERQFAEMDLSSGEREVALALLQGLSLHEIADARHAAHRVVRRQAEAVYRKANASGHVELAAFLLDRMLPDAHELDAPPSS